MAPLRTPAPHATEPAFPSRSIARIRAAARPPQTGQGSVEFLFAAIPVLLLGLGSIEAVHWYFSRQAVSLALVQAARAAATRHADPAVLDESFAHALLPLFAGPDQATSRRRLEQRIARREQATGLPAWNIRMLSPSHSSFADFQSLNPDLPQHHGQPVIDNDYIHEQHQARLNQGWADGRGPLSGQTTLEANTLVLHLTWLHEPLLPGVKQLLRQLAPGDARYGSVAMRRAGFLPLRRELAMVMQSHAIAWQMPPHGRIERNSHPSDAAAPATQAHSSEPGRLSTADAHSCQGLWCMSGLAGNHEMERGGLEPALSSSGGQLSAVEASIDASERYPASDGLNATPWPWEADQRPADPGVGAGDTDARAPEGGVPDAWAPEAGEPDVLEDCPGCC